MARPTFDKAFVTNIIYVYTIDVADHRDCVKVGKASTDIPNPTDEDIKAAALARIKEQTKTSGVKPRLEWVEKAILTNKHGIEESFMDYPVHEVLKRSGVKKKQFGTGASEWFQCSVETAKKAIKAVKEGRTTLNEEDVTAKWEPLSYRPEQLDAIEKTIIVFANDNDMLWNAKMRFGKTVSSLEVVKRMNLCRTLIITHRSVVIDGWYKDFDKVFGDRRNDFFFGSKTLGKNYDEIEELADKRVGHYIYFASIQDLRGSAEVSGKFEKNEELFATPWDLLIIDEAHEGTLTMLGDNVFNALKKDHTKVLRLSGTPYNLLEKFDSNNVYTWDYTMEQKAKAAWDEEHPGEPNPYAMLPTMNLYTYDIARLMGEVEDDEYENVAFNFREFFRTDGDYDRFIHEDKVRAFLDLLVNNDVGSLYPYSNDLFQAIFRHTLWMLPGVKAARALSKLLKEHPTFKHYTIVNVAGEGDEEEEAEEALAKLNAAITSHPERTKTITLSCGRLTTGVTVPAWTGVFMLSGSAKTSASSYMQTIFRVQSPGSIGGLMKEQCYVFDFAPDRALQVLAEANHIQNFKKEGTTTSDRERLEEFLNFCPVIAMDGSDMKPYSVDTLLRQLKRVFIERVVQSGFDDIHIFDKATFSRLSTDELKMFEKLQGIIGKTKALPKTKAIDVNRSDLTDEEYETVERAEEAKKEGKRLTPEQKEALDKLNAQRKQQETASSILRGISIRMPLMVYGANLKHEAEELTIDNFTNIVDDDSWKEFMPKGVTKELLNEFKQYFDKEIFTGASMRIRELVREADKMNIEERIEQITSIFSYFRNPDKETVLTPWRVVNMHMGDTIGGWNFYNKDFAEPPLVEPRFIDNGEVTQEVFSPDSRALEINSKSGLYPLYVAYSIYKTRRKEWEKNGKKLTHDEQQNLWYTVLKDNVFVICMTPMAEAITRRTLAGFNKVVVNAKHYEHLLEEIKTNKDKVISTVCQGKTFWRTNNDDNMKFNAIVGNPPYQVMDGGAGVSAKPVYNIFVDFAQTLKPNYISMIMPAKWYTDGKGLDQFRMKMLNDKRIVSLFDYTDSRDCFSNVDIAGGICYFLWSSLYHGKCNFTSIHQGVRSSKERDLSEMDEFIRHIEAISIIEKVKSRNKSGFYDKKVSTRKPFGLSTDTLPLDLGDITLRYNGGKGLYDSSLISKGIDMINKWNIIISRLTAEHAGQTDKNGQKKILSSLDFLAPNEICTETYLVVDSFATKIEATNLYSYLCTRFVRFLIAQLASTQQMTKDKFVFVPLQDFTPQSDIDWSKSIPEIDRQLYDKYNLTETERDFIERMIKPME